MKRSLAEADLPGLVPSGPAPNAVATPHGAEGHRGRMREKLLRNDADGILDHELLEMVLFLALPRRDTKPLARALLSRFGSFAGVIAAPIPDLLSEDGLGEAAAAALKTVQAAAIRLIAPERRSNDVLSNWDAMLDYLSARLSRERVEQLRVLYLDNRNRLLADEAQSRGTVNHTPVYPREVVKRAIELRATALILVHNHPSGDPTPSREDIAMTAEIKAAAQLLDIVLHDHVIVGNGKWTSFRREGLL